MSHGLRVTNASGDVVIDETYRNHVVVAGGSVSVGAYPGWGDAYAASVTLAAPIPMARGPLVWGRTGTDRVSCGLLGVVIDGSGALSGFHVTGRPDSDLPIANPAVQAMYPITVQWRVTALPSGPSAESWGLRVFDAAGDVAFDSGLDYLRIHHATAGVSVPGTPAVNATYAALADPWFCLSACAALSTGTLSGDDTLWLAAMARRESSTQAALWLGEYGYQAGDTFYAYGNSVGMRRLVVAR